MNLTVERNTLLEGLSFVSRRAKARANIAILGHVLLHAKGGTLTILGHDLDACSKTEIDAETASEGSWALPAESLLRLVKGLPGVGHIQIRVSGPQASVVCGKSQYKIPVLGAEDFPPQFVLEKPTRVTLDGAAVHRLLAMPAGVAEIDNPTDYYKGVTLQVTDGKIIAFASNGRRMVRTASPTEAEDAAPIVVYRPSIDEIVRLCGKDGGQFAWTPRLLSVRTGDNTFTTRLLDTTPPPFDRYVAEKVPAVEPFIEIDREALASAINRLEIVASQSRIMSFEWKANPRELRLSVAGNGEGSETIECVGAKMKAGYFGVAISDALGVLNAMKAETIRIAPVANTQPFRVIDPTDSEFVAVLAPCRAGADVIARHAA